MYKKKMREKAAIFTYIASNFGCDINIYPIGIDRESCTNQIKQRQTKSFFSLAIVEKKCFWENWFFLRDKMGLNRIFFW